MLVVEVLCYVSADRLLLNVNEATSNNLYRE